MKKNIGKAIAIIGGLILIIGIVFIAQEKFQSPTPQNPDQGSEGGKPGKPGGEYVGGDIEDIQTEDKNQEEINALVDAIFNYDAGQKKLNELTGKTVDNYYIFYGKDSYIRSLGSDMSGLDQYKKKQKEYAASLEKIIKDNFELETTNYIISDDGAVIQDLKYRTYYYSYFIQDYTFLADELLKYTDVNLGVIAYREYTKEEKEKMYKIEIKALEIMSNYFDDYINDNEEKEYTLMYRKANNGSIVNEYFSLLINFNGSFYNNEKFSINTREQRVKGYISEAISSGQLDTSNPYKLK
jgi:hypothetical protein